MRKLFLGLVFFLGAAGAAQAGEFVVVSSNDPMFRAGRELTGGSTVPLAAGKTLVVISASGAVSKLMGGPNGAMIPMAQMASIDSQRVEVLKLLVAQPRTRRSGALPSKPCPGPETLTEIDAIAAAAGMTGCVPAARQAFGVYVERALGEPLPQPQT